MATKLYDLTVATGKYTNSEGQERNRYKNIGSVMQNDDGGKFILLDATVVTMELNYLANHDRRDAVIVNLFKRDDQQGQGQQQTQQRQQSTTPPPQTQQGTAPSNLREEDIPF